VPSSFAVDVIVHSEGRWCVLLVDAGVSLDYRSQCRPATGVASGKCRPGTGATVSLTYRNSTHAELWCRCGAGALEALSNTESQTLNHPLSWAFPGADDGTRTRDPHLGKVYGYSRLTCTLAEAAARVRFRNDPAGPLLTTVVVGLCVFGGGQVVKSRTTRTTRSMASCFLSTHSSSQ
jgi:hypothetical protein